MKKRYLLLLLLLSVCLVGCGTKIEDGYDAKMNYIENSNKSSFVDLAIAYVKSVTTEVNLGYELKFYSTNTLYLVPVGDRFYKSGGESCVMLDSSGKSPYSDGWNYAYVGVIYNGQGFNYFFIAEDKSGHGLSFMTYKELLDNGTNHIYVSKDDENYSSVVKDKKIAMNTMLHDALVSTYKDKENHFTDKGYTFSGADDILSLTERKYIRIYGKCKD